MNGYIASITEAFEHVGSLPFELLACQKGCYVLAVEAEVLSLLQCRDAGVKVGPRLVS